MLERKVGTICGAAAARSLTESTNMMVSVKGESQMLEVREESHTL